MEPCHNYFSVLFCCMWKFLEQLVMLVKNLVHFVEWKKISDGDMDQVLCQLVDWGIDALVAHPCWGMREQELPGYLPELNRKFRLAGLNTPACHAFWGKGYDLGYLSEEQKMDSLRQHSDFLLYLGSMGVKTYTLHPGFQKAQPIPEAVWRNLAANVELLLPAAEDAGIILALENGQEAAADLEKLVDLISGFKHSSLGLCFDSGHAHCYSGLGVSGALTLCSDQIVTCHLHDNDGSGDQHNPPGEGSIDWQAMIPALKKCPRLVHAETESGNWSEQSWRKFREVWAMD